jgi:hypothetical protein
MRRAIQHLPGFHFLDFVMHGLLIAKHITLFIVSRFHLENRVRVSEGEDTEVLSTAISIATQTIAIVCRLFFPLIDAELESDLSRHSHWGQ